MITIYFSFQFTWMSQARKQCHLRHGWQDVLQRDLNEMFHDEEKKSLQEEVLVGEMSEIWYQV